MEMYRNIQKASFPCKGTAPLLKNGGYLLSHLRSTIGVTGLNFSVRDGKRWNPRAVTTLYLFNYEL